VTQILRHEEVETVESAQIGTCDVPAGRVPLFCDTALAGRIERVEARFIAQCSAAARRRAGTAAFVIPIAGGRSDPVPGLGTEFALP
jgi:hypothetical protein